MHEAIFRIVDGGLVADVTADTDARVTLWCSDDRDLLHVVGGDADMVVDDIDGRVGIETRTGGATGRLAVTETCLVDHIEHNVERYLARHDCLLLPPLRYADGEKLVRVLAVDPDDLTAVYRDLVAEGHDIHVERKRALSRLRQHRPLLTLEEVLPDLTDRQLEALLAAHDRGYYEVPRETTTADVADEMGVQRRTAEEHLRRAERKVVNAVRPYLQ